MAVHLEAGVSVDNPHDDNTGSGGEGDAAAVNALLASPAGHLVFRFGDGHIVAANPALANLTGFSAQQIEGSRLTSLVAADDAVELARQLQVLEATGSCGPCRLFLQGLGGRIIPVVACGRLLAGDTQLATLALQLLPFDGDGKLRLQLLSQLYRQSGEAFLVTDAQNRIVAVNPAFTRLTGYAPEDVAGRDPRLLASGRSTAEDYRAMWRDLECNGFWQGEIWDRRKDGGMYPKWMAISVVRDEAGKVCNYVASFTDISERREASDRLAHLATHDALTRLPNRFSLEGQIQHAINTCHRDNRQMAVLLIDLDRFKSINDTLGHHVGDALLVEVAKRLSDCVRASDIVARLGGDEFVVVLPDIENALRAANIAGKIQRSLAEGCHINGTELFTTPSIGISIFPADGSDPETLLRNADTAMYHAKSAGRNNHQFFASRMNEAAAERMQLENALRQALSAANLIDAQFSLHFQPQLHIASGRIISVEALARWTHPLLGTVPPTRFIPAAEETGLIQALGDWVFWEACRQMRKIRDAGITDVRMAVNLSAQQLRQEGLPAVVRGALACFELQPADLELEITESTAMQNPELTLHILDQLSDMGIVLAIDDFGTGYSSLAYLKHLPIHRLKLDRSFVQDIETDQSDAAICSATVALGHNLGLELVAEGVETAAQRDYLAGLGCDALQGFLYSHPLPADQIVDFLRRYQPAPLAG